jgi:hypothetical protein
MIIIRKSNRYLYKSTNSVLKILQYKQALRSWKKAKDISTTPYKISTPSLSIRSKVAKDRKVNGIRDIVDLSVSILRDC